MKELVCISNTQESISKLNERISSDCLLENYTDETISNVNLVLEEVLLNIVNYGYSDSNAHIIRVKLNLKDEYIKIKIKDDGIAFNPLLKETPLMPSSIDELNVGGWGIHLVKSISSSLKYRRKDNLNILKIKLSAEKRKIYAFEKIGKLALA